MQTAKMQEQQIILLLKSTAKGPAEGSEQSKYSYNFRSRDK